MSNMFDLFAGIPLPLPHWANGFAFGYSDIGAQLCTRDGTRMGNAVVYAQVKTAQAGGVETSSLIVTDIGNHLVLSIEEMEELFYFPVYTMDLTTHNGVLCFLAKYPMGAPEH